MRTRFVPLVLASVAAKAQTFEAASIKPSTPLGPLGRASNQKGGPGTTDPGLFTCTNCSLYWIMADAYPFHSYDFSGPDWLDSTRFDFSAKMPAGATQEVFRAMLQNLLADRFKLSVHREKREVLVYELSVGKNGAKFHEGTPKDEPEDDAPRGKPSRDDDGSPILRPGKVVAMVPEHGRLRSDNQPMEWLAGILANQLGSAVMDATGLRGRYDFVLSWAWERDSPGGPVAASADSLIREVQSQLGLRLERRKGQVEVLLVDHMEKTPTET